jgi:hypothetical protein
LEFSFRETLYYETGYILKILKKYKILFDKDNFFPANQASPEEHLMQFLHNLANNYASCEFKKKRRKMNLK